MKAVIQRVKEASVVVDKKTISQIGPGILTLLGIEKGDSVSIVEKGIQKIIDLRIFEDENRKMNLSLKDVGGEHLIVSQFTLLGDCSQGRRPSFIQAEEPKRAEELYTHALSLSKTLLGAEKTKGGQFQADMKVQLINDGPVTFILEFK
jgi:D-tyrosyl-tRNA(Tyr) deacylase